jgi:hypothetical protein
MAKKATATKTQICKLVAEVKGTGMGLLMHKREELANPLSKTAREIKTLTSKRNKPVEVWEKIFELEWHGGLYHMENEKGKSRVFVPGMNVRAMLIEAAKSRKLGTKFKRTVQANDVFLDFPDKDKSPEQLWEVGAVEEGVDGTYRYIVPVVISGRTVMRSRPIFPQWSATLEIIFDSGMVDEDELISILKYGGQYVGLCERTLGHGRFAVLDTVVADLND